jgi:hypothetical protein
MDDVPHEHSRLATPESEVATYSFNKHDAFYDPVERNPQRVLTVAKAWPYLIATLMGDLFQLPACYLQFTAGPVLIHCALKGVTVE